MDANLLSTGSKKTACHTTVSLLIGHQKRAYLFYHKCLVHGRGIVACSWFALA